MVLVEPIALVVMVAVAALVALLVQTTAQVLALVAVALMALVAVAEAVAHYRGAIVQAVLSELFGVLVVLSHQLTRGMSNESIYSY